MLTPKTIVNCLTRPTNPLRDRRRPRLARSGGDDLREERFRNAEGSREPRARPAPRPRLESCRASGAIDRIRDSAGERRSSLRALSDGWARQGRIGLSFDLLSHARTSHHAPIDGGAAGRPPRRASSGRAAPTSSCYTATTSASTCTVTAWTACSRPTSTAWPRKASGSRTASAPRRSAARRAHRSLPDATRTPTA